MRGLNGKIFGSKSERTDRPHKMQINSVDMLFTVWPLCFWIFMMERKYPDLCGLWTRPIPHQSIKLGSLRKDVFERRTSNRKWTFCKIRQWFRLNFWASRLYDSKDTKHYAFGSVKVLPRTQTSLFWWKCARKGGREGDNGRASPAVCTLTMVLCGSSAVTRFALASAMRKTKRLRRRLVKVY